MNNKIKAFHAELKLVTDSAFIKTGIIRDSLQAEYNKVFDDSREWSKAISNAENSSEYQLGYDGDIESWFRVSALANIPEEAREFFETWLGDNYSMRVDWNNSCLLVNHGDDNLIIQDDTRHDNGVWQSGKRVIDETEYKTEDDEVDEDKRNELIEAHMERTGYFPGVFRVDSYGSVFAVSTQPKKAVS